MHTARSLTVSPSMHCAGGSAPRVVPGLGGPAPGGCLVRGMSGWGGAWSGGGIAACIEADPPPLWTEFMTHASENITLPQTSFAGGENERYYHPRMRISNNFSKARLSVSKGTCIVSF